MYVLENRIIILSRIQVHRIYAMFILYYLFYFINANYQYKIYIGMKICTMNNGLELHAFLS